MRKIVGYFEGTDSTLLTGLVCDGYDTVPISNGFDNHGMHVRIINNENKVDLLIGVRPQDLRSGGLGAARRCHVRGYLPRVPHVRHPAAARGPF